MHLITLSPCIVTEKIVESRDFYVKHFGAKVVFDCGEYVNLELSPGAAVQFMSPRPGQEACTPAGLAYNLRVADVDTQYRALVSSGLTIVMPLEDHPWGDRGFAVHDPNGVILYLYADREPSPEFKPFYSAQTA